MALLILFCGCAHGREDIVVAPMALEEASATLHAGQPAGVRSTGGESVTVEPDQTVDVVSVDGNRFRVRVADIVGDCPPAPPEGDRLCQLHGVSRVVVGERRPPSDAKITGGHVLAGAFVLGAGGLGACAGLCPGPYDLVAGGILVAAAVGFMSLLLTSGLH